MTLSYCRALLDATSHSLCISLFAHSARTALLPLCLAMSVGLTATRIEAACAPDPPSDDDTVVCDGTDETGFDASGATRLTITTIGAAELDDSGALDAAILISDDNDVTIGGAATVTVTEAGGAGVRGGDRNTVTNDGTIVVNEADGVAIDVGSVDVPDPTPSPEVTNNGTIELNAADSVGLHSVDNYNLTNSATGTITIGAGASGAIGIQGQDDNFVVSNGTITIDASATDARAISIRDNTGVDLPNGAVLGASSVTTIGGDRGIAIEVGDNVGTAASGTIDLQGNETVGLSIGDKIDPLAEANHTNQGTITVGGNDSFGIRAGDGWLDGGATPNAGALRNFGTIEVAGTDSFGVFAGDATNATGDNNSFVLNVSPGLIDVTGTDSIGLSVGGNDFLTSTNSVFDDLFTVDNSGIIRGDEDAGALIVFRDFVGTFENRLHNAFGASITADLTHQGTANRGLAVMGTAGIEVIENAGSITGDLMLGDGDNVLDNSGTGRIDGDIFFGIGDDTVTNTGFIDQDIDFGDGANILDNTDGTISGTLTFGAGNDTVSHAGSIGGNIHLGDGNDIITLDPETDAMGFGVVIDGGDGNDTLQLEASTTHLQTLDLDAVTPNFENLVLRGIANTDPGWTLLNGEGLTGSVALLAEAALTAVTPVTLGGNLTIDSTAALTVTANDADPAITVNGDATFDGSITVTSGSITPGSVRVIQVDGTRTGTFASEVLPADAGVLSFSSAYDVDGFLLLVTSSGFSGVAQGANNTAIATHLDAIFADASGDAGLVSTLSEYATGSDSLNNLFTTLSPEAYDPQTTIAIESGRRLAHLLFGRPRDCELGDRDPWTPVQKPLACHSQKLSAWVSGIGSFRERDGFAGHPEYDATIGGAVLGIDFVPIGDLELTLALSGQHGTIDVTGAGESDLTLAEITGHAAWRRGPLRLQASVGYGHGFHESSRSVFFDAAATDVRFDGEDDYESRRVTIAGHAGFLFEVGPVQIEPVISADWVWIDQDSVGESGDPFALSVASRDDQVVSATAGLRLGTLYHHTRYLHTNLEWIDGIWRPTLAVRWRQYLTGYDRSIDARLVGAPDTVGNFSIDGKEDRGGFEIEAGLSFVPKHANRLQFDLRYEAYRASHTVDHDLVAKIRIGF